VQTELLWKYKYICTLRQYLLLLLHKTVPNLALPNQLGIPFPSPAYLTLAPNPDVKKIKLDARWFFKKTSQN